MASVLELARIGLGFTPDEINTLNQLISNTVAEQVDRATLAAQKNAEAKVTAAGQSAREAVWMAAIAGGAVGGAVGFLLAKKL